MDSENLNKNSSNNKYRKLYFKKNDYSDTYIIFFFHPYIPFIGIRQTLSSNLIIYRLDKLFIILLHLPNAYCKIHS